MYSSPALKSTVPIEPAFTFDVLSTQSLAWHVPAGC